MTKAEITKIIFDNSYLDIDLWAEFNGDGNDKGDVRKFNTSDFQKMVDELMDLFNN